MDGEQEGEQQNSSSVSSSNNSSSSNLLANLPMLLMLHAHESEEDELEDRLPPQSTSSSRLGVDQQNAPSTGSSQLLDNSVFISPLLFNNNSTPPPSSSSSSSSSSSHNLHRNHHHHHHHHEHFEHPHHEHSPPPSSHQQQAPSLLHAQEHLRDNPDDYATAETIDASIVATVGDDIALNADVASTSHQPPEEQDSPPDTANTASRSETSVAADHAPQSFALSLPLLFREETKETSPLSTQFSRSFTSSFHRHTNFGGCSALFRLDAITSNGAAMFSDNAASISSAGGNSHHHQHQVVDRIKLLYPNVNENETPLPRCWSPHDKCLSIGLSQNNLRVNYKGTGKQHNDAASVRTAYPIPPACGLYYFEVKIISKGKNGYMGIGLTAQQFRMNRLPGWDKQSYGYHGDDGNSFSSSGNGQSYGPTFTTGDIIGCCVNFVNNTCFYTKNGVDLGVAFRDLPTKLYPTVGLQTPGEEVDANFGQEPFKFDQIEDMMKQMRAEMKTTIYNYPMPADQGDTTTLLHRMVSSYLVHNGFSQTAEAFSRTAGQSFREDLTSIRNRQKILKLVMAGKMGQAIDHTLRSYPGLLESNKNLWFMLKCRQFIEMVNGSDIEYYPPNNKITISTTTQTQSSTLNQTSVIQSTKTYQNGKSVDATNKSHTSTNSTVINMENHQHEEDPINLPTTEEHCVPCDDNATKSKNNDVLATNNDYTSDVEMENNIHATNGDTCKNGDLNNSLDADEDMEVDVSPSSRKYNTGIERILEFGKELSQMGQQLEKENKMNDEDRQMLEDAFSLIAYSNPWSSPLGWQLCPTKRETVCTALNSAILESLNYPRRPPLEVCVAHASELLKAMAHASLGACAFINIEDIFPQN